MATIIDNVESTVFDKNILGVDSDEKVLSPGMKYRHYAPKTKCKLVYSEDNQKLKNRIEEIAKSHKNPLIITTTTNTYSYQPISMGKTLEEISHNLFATLRNIDNNNYDIAIIEGVKNDGIGFAIMNRLIRACDHDFEII